MAMAYLRLSDESCRGLSSSSPIRKGGQAWPFGLENS
jgi:hypothetical protein